MDREMQMEHEIQVTVTDNRFPSLSSTTAVIVSFEDVNDNVPVFEHSLSLCCHGDTAWPCSTESGNLLWVVAADKDIGKNGEIHYSLTSGENWKKFHIHRQNGYIYPVKPLLSGDEYILNMSSNLIRIKFHQKVPSSFTVSGNESYTVVATVSGDNFQNYSCLPSNKDNTATSPNRSYNDANSWMPNVLTEAYQKDKGTVLEEKTVIAYGFPTNQSDDSNIHRILCTELPS